MLSAGARAAGGPSESVVKDPELTIPWCRQAPALDGRIQPDEWRQAAVVSMLEAYPLYWPQAVRQEQPLFYVFRDRDYLYVAMDALASSHNAIVAQCVMHDARALIDDDCLELMIAPGSGADLKRFDFPTYYIALNHLGTVWDSKFVTNLAESHNSWESGVETAHAVEGTRWVCELRIPFAAIRKDPPAEGETWRMNFCRTYHKYNWNVWQATGGLNDARVGGNVRFDREAPAVRLMTVDEVVDGKCRIGMEVFNGSERERTVKVRLSCAGADEKGVAKTSLGAWETEVAVGPGKTADFKLGDGVEIKKDNTVEIVATDARGATLLAMTRHVIIPAPRFVMQKAPPVALVHVDPRFLPSLDRLAVTVDATAWAKKRGVPEAALRATTRVFRKGGAPAPVLEGTLTEFKGLQGTWRGSTRELPEGEYEVGVRVVADNGDVLVEHADWFEKRIFEWMKTPRGVGEAVPNGYSPLAAKGRDLSLWGREYRFGERGLMDGLASQGQALLAGRMEWAAVVDGKAEEVRAEVPYAFGAVKPTEAAGRAALAAGALKMDLQAVTEYDGLTRFRLTYGPKAGAVVVNRLRVKVPLVAKHAKYFSAAGDVEGVTILGDVVPDRQGKVYDSAVDTRAVCVSPTFSTLYWVGDDETCFCYAADSDTGWVLRDDAPAVEAWRQGDELILWLNLVDRKVTLSGPRALEFAFQAGPVRALPPGWRGIQEPGYPGDHPHQVIPVGVGGDNTMFGGAYFIHPGTTPELREKSRRKISATVAGGNRSAVGYNFWGRVPKGMPEARVFRGEWGIDKDTWEHATEVVHRKWEWEKRYYGENKDLYISLPVKPVPSYVDFLSYAYDEALKETAIGGFYDDCGLPVPVFDEELGIGSVRDDGRRIWSCGLWLYRERVKRAAYLNFLHGRPNFLRDSQHVRAHYLPAHGFFGIWAPCETGFYNPFSDRNNLEFYSSLDRYAAFNPSRAFGQIAMIGMSVGAYNTTLGGRNYDAALFAGDTRGIMMLALLNDQDVGSFGERDPRIVNALRHARNGFKPWEDGVEFVGHWQSAAWARVDGPGMKTSLYHRPDGVLWVLGNTGDADAEARVQPDWARLKLDPAGLTAVNAETGGNLGLDAPGTGFTVAVPRHDVRLVVTAPAGRYVDPAAGRPLGTDLPGPATIMKELGDTLAGTALAPGWVRDVHEGAAGVWMLDGRLCVQGNPYGYAHVRRELNVDNLSVQCLTLKTKTGSADIWSGSLFLLWPNGEFAQATPGIGEGRFIYRLSGAGDRRGGAVGRLAVPGWHPYVPNWVKIVLTPETIVFHGSADGKAWNRDWEAARGAKHAGAPRYVLLGTGAPGKEPLLKNVHSRHFSPIGPVRCFFSDLIVGRE